MCENWKTCWSAPCPQDGGLITADDLQFSTMTPRNPATGSCKTDEPGAQSFSTTEAYGDMKGYLDDIERRNISTALEESRWNKAATTKLLGISFRKLHYLLMKLGLED